ncbi:MAG: RNA helicase required for poly(A+) mRNA export [Alyxoria varia]|nr:MAG: RNA helicase required for poly(A+) mRNA export [Alyxoria varia]
MAEPSSKPLEERITRLNVDDEKKTTEAGNKQTFLIKWLKGYESDDQLTDVDDILEAPAEDKGRDKASELSSAQTDGANEKMGGSGLQEPEFDVHVKLADIQADPNNPLYSVKSFEELHIPKTILDGIYHLNFRRPSKIQERALPLLLSDPPTNLIGQSQSGTGKTAAFVLNILTRIKLDLKQPQALIVAPSRELARQIHGVVQTMASFTEGFVVSQAIPDPNMRGVKIEGHVVVGTPGTVTDTIRKRLFDVSQVKVLVLDEADNMLDQQGLGDQCTRVKSLLPKNLQIVLFSATFPDYVTRYADRFAPNSNQITLKHEELTVEGIKQLYMDCDSEQHKYECLVKLYGLMTIGSSIIFVKRRDTAAEIEKRMTSEGHTVASLTGALEGAERDSIIDKFRNGQAKVLITTNVLARGIDVQSVSMVINYDVPEKEHGIADPETYLHRIGRTGRFGRVGVSITFVYNEQSFRVLSDIAEFYGVTLSKLPTNDWDEAEKIVKQVIKSSRSGAQALKGKGGLAS